MVQETATRLGVALLVLGAMHFFNLFVFHLIRRPLRQKVVLPLNYNPYQPSPGA
jgi:hypothetical protein